MDRKIVDVAMPQLGLVLRQQLLLLGLDDDAICRRLESGRLEVVHPGVYRIPGGPITLEQRLMAALLAAGPYAAVSFGAAARVYRTETVRTTDAHVTVVHAQRSRLTGVIVHRTRLWAPGDIVQRGPLRVTSPYRTIIDLAGVLTPDDLEDALDEFVRRRLVGIDALKKRLDARGRRGVRGAGHLAMLLEMRSGRRPKGSTLQNRFRRGLERAGLPSPQEEYEIRDPSGRFLGRVDFAYPDLKVFIEVDGSGHETPKQRRADTVRQNGLARAGWRPLRYDRNQINAKIYVGEIGDLFRSGESNSSPVRSSIPQKPKKR